MDHKLEIYNYYNVGEHRDTRPAVPARLPGFVALDAPISGFELLNTFF
jgi:hypothetical protein